MNKELMSVINSRNDLNHNLQSGLLYKEKVFDLVSLADLAKDSK